MRSGDENRPWHPRELRCHRGSCGIGWRSSSYLIWNAPCIESLPTWMVKNDNISRVNVGKYSLHGDSWYVGCMFGWYLWWCACVVEWMMCWMNVGMIMDVFVGEEACKIKNVGSGVVKVHLIEMLQQTLGLTCKKLFWLLFWSHTVQHLGFFPARLSNKNHVDDSFRWSWKGVCYDCETAGKLKLFDLTYCSTWKISKSHIDQTRLVFPL